MKSSLFAYHVRTEIIENHKVLCWDFDETLVNREGAEAFWRFITENPYGQEHHIITMRSHGMEEEIFSILEEHRTGLTPVHFVSVLNVPDHLFESHFQAALRQHNTDNHPYNHWKARQCKQIGARLLIDDMGGTNISVAGCEALGIELIHPDELLEKRHVASMNAGNAV